MKRNKRKKKARKTAIVKEVSRKLLVILFLGLLIYLPFFIYQGIRKSVWDGKNNLNFVIQTDRTFIYSFHPDDEILNIISLPEDLYFKTAKGYGEYKLKNIYHLGEMEKIGGGELLVLSLQNFFTVPIDGQITKIPKFQNSKIPNNDLERGRLTPLCLCLLTKRCESNLSWWDLFRIFNRIRRLKLNQVRLIAVEETALLKKEKLADNSEVLRLETALIDDFSQKYFLDKSFLNEGFRITIVNATNYPGLAKNAARLLKNIGGEIISSQDTDKTSESSIIYCSDNKETKVYSVNKIKAAFQIEEVLLNEELEEDIRVVLGKDFLQRYY